MLLAVNATSMTGESCTPLGAGRKRDLDPGPVIATTICMSTCDALVRRAFCASNINFLAGLKIRDNRAPRHARCESPRQKTLSLPTAAVALSPCASKTGKQPRDGHLPKQQETLQLLQSLSSVGGGRGAPGGNLDPVLLARSASFLAETAGRERPDSREEFRGARAASRQVEYYCSYVTTYGTKRRLLLLLQLEKYKNTKLCVCDIFGWHRERRYP